MYLSVDFAILRLKNRVRGRGEGLTEQIGSMPSLFLDFKNNIAGFIGKVKRDRVPGGKLETDQIKLQLLQQDYKAFSKAAGLRMQHERLEKVGFAWKEATEAKNTYQSIAKQANSMYDTGSEAGNIAAWQRDKPIRESIRADKQRLIINQEKQSRHIKGTDGYVQGRSYVTVDKDELQAIVNQYAGTGEIQRSVKGVFMQKEIITIDRQIGVSINPETLEETPTNRAYIHYSKSGSHVVPTAKEMKK